MSEIKIKVTPGDSIPGIHEWNRRSYDMCEAMNWSRYGGWDENDPDFCPAEARHAEEFQDATEAMIFGTRLHSRVLTPDEFKIEYAVEKDWGPLRSPKGKATPKEAATYKANKSYRDNWYEVNGKKEHIPKKDGELIERMRDSLMNHPVCGPLLELPSRRELTVISEINGTMVKSLLDIEVEIPDLPGWKALGFEPGLHLADLKSTRTSVSPDSWGRSMAKWKYHGQGGFYTDNYERATYERATGKTVQGFIFMPVCKEGKLSAACYVMSARDLRWGQMLYKRCMESRAKWQAKGEYPGFTPRLQTTMMPEWSSEGDDFV